jgi:chemotaxis protein CheX
MTLSADNDMDVVAFTDIVVIAQDIWASFLDLPLEPVPLDTVDISAMPMVGGVVTVHESWSGAVQLETSAEFAAMAARRMFAADGSVTEVDLDDALGELTNMIGGNIKSLLPAPSQLSLPMVSESVWPTTVPGSVAVCRIAFSVGADVAHISVWQS